MELDPVARDIVLRSIREAIPSDWRAKCEELRSLGDIYARHVPRGDRPRARRRLRQSTELERACDERSAADRCRRTRRRRDAASVGRLLHVDDQERLDAYRSLINGTEPPDPNSVERARPTFARMLIASTVDLRVVRLAGRGFAQLWEHPQVEANSSSCSSSCPSASTTCIAVWASRAFPSLSTLATHGRRSSPRSTSATGSSRRPGSRACGGTRRARPTCSRSPSTSRRLLLADDSIPRLRDQPGAHPLGEPVGDVARKRTGRRYVARRSNGTNVVLFARLNTDDRAFWCLGPATVRLPSRRTPDRDHVATPSPPTRRPLRRVRRCGRVIVPSAARPAKP